MTCKECHVMDERVRDDQYLPSCRQIREDCRRTPPLGIRNQQVLDSNRNADFDVLEQFAWLRRRERCPITNIIGAAMHVKPVVFRPQIEDSGHAADAVVRRLIAQLGRCVRRDGSQSLAELAPEVGLTRLHDPENGPHRAVDECRRDRRV